MMLDDDEQKKEDKSLGTNENAGNAEKFTNSDDEDRSLPADAEKKDAKSDNESGSVSDDNAAETDGIPRIEENSEKKVQLTKSNEQDDKLLVNQLPMDHDRSKEMLRLGREQDWAILTEKFFNKINKSEAHRNSNNIDEVIQNLKETKHKKLANLTQKLDAKISNSSYHCDKILKRSNELKKNVLRNIKKVENSLKKQHVTSTTAMSSLKVKMIEVGFQLQIINSLDSHLSNTPVDVRV